MAAVGFDMIADSVAFDVSNFTDVDVILVVDVCLIVDTGALNDVDICVLAFFVVDLKVVIVVGSGVIVFIVAVVDVIAVVGIVRTNVRSALKLCPSVNELSNTSKHSTSTLYKNPTVITDHLAERIFESEIRQKVNVIRVTDNRLRFHLLYSDSRMQTESARLLNEYTLC